MQLRVTESGVVWILLEDWRFQLLVLNDITFVIDVIVVEMRDDISACVK